MKLSKAFLFVLLLSCLHGAYSGSDQRHFTSIYSFGDSYADTGNLAMWEDPVIKNNFIKLPPYGETFFGHPSGRASNGRIVLDFIADALGLPFVPPVLAKGQNFSNGANFAVSGAPALNLTYLQKQNITVFIPINSSLNDQLRWFDKLKPSLCQGGSDCFAQSLFIMGVFGGNDYLSMFISNKTLEQARTYVPKIINTIGDGVERLIEQGAKCIVVADIFPTGCLPVILTGFATMEKAGYDQYGCLKSFNALLSRYHNTLLHERVVVLRKKHPHAKIIFAEYYRPVVEFLRNPEHFGFNPSTTLTVCCGFGGGCYNYNPSMMCGAPGAAACADPAKAINWDGSHLTEAAYRSIADGWLHGPYANPPILHTLL